jgi:hypothetical protein
VKLVGWVHLWEGIFPADAGSFHSTESEKLGRTQMNAAASPSARVGAGRARAPGHDGCAARSSGGRGEALAAGRGGGGGAGEHGGAGQRARTTEAPGAQQRRPGGRAPCGTGEIEARRAADARLRGGGLAHWRGGTRSFAARRRGAAQRGGGGSVWRLCGATTAGAAPFSRLMTGFFFLRYMGRWKKGNSG